MLINIGHHHYIPADEILLIIPSDTQSAVARMNFAKERGMYTDATKAERRRSLVITKTGEVIATFRKPDTLRNHIHRETTPMLIITPGTLPHVSEIPDVGSPAPDFPLMNKSNSVDGGAFQ